MQTGFVFKMGMAITLILSSYATSEEYYYVEPMICKGVWNANPPKYDLSYAQVALKVISFWSVRSSDCSLAPSSSTEANYAHANSELVTGPEMELWGWIGVPLKRNGDNIRAPFGAWSHKLELKIVSSRLENGVQIDTLEGRDQIQKGYYYDLKCEARVVHSPSIINNQTHDCP